MSYSRAEELAHKKRRKNDRRDEHSVLESETYASEGDEDGEPKVASDLESGIHRGPVRGRATDKPSRSAAFESQSTDRFIGHIRNRSFAWVTAVARAPCARPPPNPMRPQRTPLAPALSIRFVLANSETRAGYEAGAATGKARASAGNRLPQRRAPHASTSRLSFASRHRFHRDAVARPSTCMGR